jgi:putative DNA primase/helicase
MKKYAVEMENEALEAWAKDSESRARISAMIELCQSLVPVQPNEFDCHIWLLNCQNGVLDLKTGKLINHDCNLMFTKITAINYNPKAVSELWESTLQKIFAGRLEVLEFVKRYAGYSLTGATKEEKFVIAYGDGGNGKTTIIGTFAKGLGSYADVIPAEVLLLAKNQDGGQGASPELAKLPGTRLLLASETEQGCALGEAKVKALSGGDEITARKLHCEPFKFQPQFKIWLQTNPLPRIRGTDSGIWRRTRLIPFLQRFEGSNCNTNIKEELSKPEHLEAVLAWAVEGCKEWLANGLQEPPEVTNATNEFRAENDVIGLFIADSCEIGEEYKTRSNDIYRAYSEWCEGTGREALNETNFGLALRKKNFGKKRDARGNVWQGVSLKGNVTAVI